MQGQKQVLVQQQRLTLSPQLVQSIKLMAMPFADLRERILEEVEKNPALEVVSDPFESDEFPPYSSGDPEQFPSAAGGGDEESDEHRDFIEGVLHRDDTLQEHLLSQLGELTLPEPVRRLAELVIQNLDHDGFHVVPPAELPGGEDKVLLPQALDAVRRLEPVGCATSGFRETLLVQAKFLAGARTAGHEDPVLDHAIDILERHFEFLEKGRPESLVKAFAKQPDIGFTVDLEEAEEIFDIIRSLDPFPGRLYDSGPVSCIVPDVIVKRTDGDFSVVINDEEIPVLGVSPFFMELNGSGATASASPPGKQHGDRRIDEASRANDDGLFADESDTPAELYPESDEQEPDGDRHDRSVSHDPGEKPTAGDRLTRNFARESVKEARWFIHTLQRRNLTILKLARALVVFQRDFFMHGPAHVSPLRMKDIAEEIGMHEATVSRAANGKYLQCEWGLFELKYFFSNQVGSAKSAPSTGGQAAYTAGSFSKQGVKEIIREIIAESKENLSDQKIADLLAKRGISIARRTVAKYRGELTIGSSFDR